MPESSGRLCSCFCYNVDSVSLSLALVNAVQKEASSTFRGILRSMLIRRFLLVSSHAVCQSRHLPTLGTSSHEALSRLRTSGHYWHLLPPLTPPIVHDHVCTRSMQDEETSPRSLECTCAV
jgi:hypothetical protein